jgi:hypothetical protein
VGRWRAPVARFPVTVRTAALVVVVAGVSVGAAVVGLRQAPVALAVAPTCTVSRGVNGLSAATQQDAFHSGAIAPVVAPDGDLYVSQTLNLSQPGNGFAAYQSINEVTPSGQTVWTYPVDQSELQMAAAGTDMVALFPSGANASAWTLLFVNMATNATSSVVLPGNYEYTLTATANSVVAVGSIPLGYGAPGPGYVAAYTPTGTLVKAWNFPDIGGEMGLNVTTAGGNVFVEAQLVNAPVTSSTQTMPAVIYEINGGTINNYQLDIPQNATGFTAASSSQVLLYGIDPTKPSLLEDLSLSPGEAPATMWQTTTVVADSIVTDGSVAVVGGVDTAPTPTAPQAVVDPAWLLNLQTGGSEGDVQMSGYGVYPVDVGPYGILAQVHSAGAPGNSQQLAVFNPDGTLVATEPENPTASGGGSFFDVNASGQLTSFHSSLLPAGTDLSFAPASTAGTCQATARERGSLGR